MVQGTLSQQAMTVINEYLHLPFPGREVSCPYYNNKRQRVRGALRVLVGKGSVRDIVDEAIIISLKEKIDLKQLSNEQLKQFLVNHNIGIDCSGLTYYILDAELNARKKAPLKKQLRFSGTSNPFRKLLRRLRPVENTNVATLADDRNSIVVAFADVKPGDMIVMRETGTDHRMDHVLIVHQINEQQSTINYTHTLQWRTDGKYQHGVRQGAIQISDATKPLVEQEWMEQNKVGNENETLEHARLAQQLEIRRLRALQNKPRTM